MAKGMKQRMLMAFFAAASVALAAAPALAQQGSDKIVRLDRPFIDQETGRVYDCRYAVGREAKVRCYEVAYRQERYGYTVFSMTVANEQVTAKAPHVSWFDEQRRDLERYWREHRRRENQRRLWERRVERDQEFQRMGEPSVDNYRQAKKRPVSAATRERRAEAGRNSKAQRERRRPGGSGAEAP